MVKTRPEFRSQGMQHAGLSRQEPRYGDSRLDAEQEASEAEARQVQGTGKSRGSEKGVGVSESGTKIHCRVTGMLL